MDGLEFCKQIKSNKLTSHIPIILLTAKSGDEDKLEGLEMGADDYIRKLFNVKVLKTGGCCKAGIKTKSFPLSKKIRLLLQLMRDLLLKPLK